MQARTLDLAQDAKSELKKNKVEIEIIKPISSGKEAMVYLVRNKGLFQALKVYKDHTTRSFKNNHEYLEGKYTRLPSERKAMSQRTKFGKDLQHKLWVKREFYLMKKLFEKGANIPEPFELARNSILMEYIGDDHGPAPKLKDATITLTEKETIYKVLTKNLELFNECGIVHADFSPFNVLYWKKKIYIIDFPQAIDIRNNPNKDELLERDLQNLEKWYKN
jgi:RIO kinase 1